MRVTVEEMVAEVEAALEDRLRLKGGDLADKLARAGRRLPAKVRAAGAELVQAQSLLPVPKLARQLDTRALARAHDTCLRHLQTVNLGLARRNLWLNILASVGFALLVVAVTVLTVVRLRGLG